MYGRQAPKMSRASTVTRGPLSCWALMMVTTGNLAKSPDRIRRLSHSVNIGKEKGCEGMCTMKL